MILKRSCFPPEVIRGSTECLTLLGETSYPSPEGQPSTIRTLAEERDVCLANKQLCPLRALTLRKVLKLDASPRTVEGETDSARGEVHRQ